MAERAGIVFAPAPSGSFALAAKPMLPLSQEDRILAALGLSRGPLPRVSLNCVVRYCRYLAAALQFPFEARCPEESGVVRPWTATVTVVELLWPTVASGGSEGELLCKALRGTVPSEVPLVDLEVDGDHPNAQLIEDYWYWFWNWRFDPEI